MSEHYRQEYSSSEQRILIPYLRELDRFAHAMVFGQGLLEIHKKIGKLNLQEIEKLLRQEKCRTYLIGLQLAGKSLESQATAKLPGVTQEFPFYLWTEVNWELPALAKLEEAGINPQQNFDRLAETGFLVAKSGTQFARVFKAGLN